MIWKEIEKKYPKASKLKDAWVKEHFYNDGFGYLNTYRDLYDFFDEQEIIIEILWYRKDFRSQVWIKNDKDVKYAKHFKTRKEAEEQAFLKAFSILENML